MSNFNSNSFFTGFITGLFIQWTNIIPVLGAFVLGLSIRNIPELIDLRDLPANIMSLIGLIIPFARTVKTKDNGKSVAPFPDDSE